MAQFALEVSYNQVSVFSATLDAPFNDWTDVHIAQGFTWRPGSVSFGTLDNIGSCIFQVFRTKIFDKASSKASRIIVVPFFVPKHGDIAAASIGSSVSLKLQPGEYELTFEHGRNADQQMWANLYFRPVSAPVKAQVLLADTELSAPAELLMTAQPA